MGQKKALNGSHLEVFLALQHSTEHDFDLSISNLFLTFVQLLQVGCVHFKDSYQFLSESLAILVQNLMDKGPDHFVYINKFTKDDEQ